VDPDEAKAMGRMLQGAKPMRMSPLNPDNVVDESTRGAILPFARYSDGGVHPAWPGMISGPAKAFKSLLSDPYSPHRGDTPENAGHKLDHVNEVAGAVGFFGAAVPRPRGSIGTGGNSFSDALRAFAAEASKPPPPVPPKVPMDTASRMARAKEMGFDTTEKWWHGSPEPDLTQIKTGLRDPGAWFTTDSRNAANYVKGEGGLYDTHLRAKNPYVVDVDPAYNGGELRLFHKGKPLEHTDNVDIVRDAFSDGYDAVHFPDGNFTESGNTMVVKHSNQIRSIDAAFDPSKASSPNLLDLNAPLAGLPFAADQRRK
jgi:ADP-Ribosyltransferase in polyvalent proteins